MIRANPYPSKQKMGGKVGEGGSKNHQNQIIQVGKHYPHFSDEEVEHGFQLVCVVRGLEDEIRLSFERLREISLCTLLEWK